MLPATVTKNAVKATIAVGTWTYSMRTASPWTSSCGDRTRAKSSSAAIPARVSAPSTRVPRDEVVPVIGAPLSAQHLDGTKQVARSRLLQQGVEDEETEADVGGREHDQQAEPAPPLPHPVVEAGLEGLGGADEDGREHREEQQRKDRLLDPERGREHPVEGAGRGEPHGGGQAGGHEERDPAHLGAVEDDHPDQQQRLQHQELR